jgi:nicotinate-nucleotide pyrophosphorylase (carboxylating)
MSQHRYHIHKNIDRAVLLALQEDHYRDDVTTKALVSPKQKCQAYILVKDDAVICGLDVVKKVFQKVDPALRFSPLSREGDFVKKNTIVATVKGKTQSILTAERTALNFLTHLSGIATTTRAYVKAVSPYKAKVLDTRKTIPGLRALEKYAVRCAGGHNHRSNLSQLILIKDNHHAVYSHRKSLNATIQDLRKKYSVPIEVEVNSLSQLKEILSAQPDMILLDNMSLAQIKSAVNLVKKHFGKTQKPLLEASGGIKISNIHQIAKTGIDRISVGALTHSVQSVDISLEIRKP